MATLSLRPAWLGTVLPALAVVAVSVGAGWWLGQRQVIQPRPVDARRSALIREAALLESREEALQATPQERQRLLELLVGLERRPEAIALLEKLADREPQHWSLRLMLAELRRHQGDRRGAERELRQILHQRPGQMEALQLMGLVLLEQGKGSEAEALIKAAYMASSKPPVKPEALGQGLLLAEVQQRRQLPAAAEATYGQLLLAFPSDQRPALGLALLRDQQGNRKGALEALDQARDRGKPEGPTKAALDRLAAEWRLKAYRQPPKSGATPPQGSLPSPRPGAPSGPPGP
ncbi:MAG: tetratricopeptide repeat protein [Cyanobacteriota bacterium]|nr:tetratricopeptide repeat protein [Cyanobacteriota bacterium]